MSEEICAKLLTVPADLIAAIKGEINTLNNEAKKHRTAGEQSATKLKSILEE